MGGPAGGRTAGHGPRTIVVVAATLAALAATAAPAAAAPNATLTNGTTNHQNVQVGRDGAVRSSIRITSTGDQPLTVGAPELLGADAAHFRIHTNTCADAGPLAPGATCTIAVGFSPTATGARSATLRVPTDGPTLTSTALSGTGRDLELSATRIDLGSVDVDGTTAPRTLTITNRDATPYAPGAVTPGSSSVGFVKGTDTCAGRTLAQGESCAVEVRFTPSSTGSRSSPVTIASYGPSPATAVGEGVGRTAALAPAVHAFGQHALGTDAPARRITLQNTGNGPLQVAAAHVLGDDADAFQVVRDRCSSTTVPVGGACDVDVRFRAEREGWRTAAVRFVTDGSPPVLVAALTGRAGVSPLTDTPAEAPFALARRPQVRLAGDGEDGVGGALGSGPCDVDGDGFDDLLSGASTWSVRPTDGSWEGAAYVTFGGPDAGSGDLRDPAGARSIRIEGEQTSASLGSQAGYAVDCAGDVDGDGLDDLAIGAWNYQYEDGRAENGRAYVVLGAKDLRSAGPLDLSRLGARGFRISAPAGAQYDHLGIAVSGLGDLDGDGLDEVAVAANVGASEADLDHGTVGTGRAGMAYVVRGRRSTADVDLGDRSSTLMRINHGVPGDATGGGSSSQLLTIAGIGDFDGDGVPDLAYGSHTARPFGAKRSAAGQVVVISGAARGELDVVDRQGVLLAAGGAFTSHRLGIGVGAAGDVDGDGLQDLIAGADSSTATSSDAAYVLFGRRGVAAETLDTRALTAADGYRILGAPASSAGHAVTGVGDVDGDGHDDLLVGGWSTDRQRGAAWLVRGVADASTLPRNDAGGASAVVAPAPGAGDAGADVSPYLALDALTAEQGGRLDGGHPGDRLGRAVGLVGDHAGDGGVSVALGADTAVRYGRSGSGEVVLVPLAGPAAAPVLPPGTDPVDPPPAGPADPPANGGTAPAPDGPGAPAPPVGRSAVVVTGASRVLSVAGRTFTLALGRRSGPAGRVRVRLRTLRAVRDRGRRRTLDVVRARTVAVGADGTTRLRLTVGSAATRVLRRTRRLSVRATIRPLDGGRVSTRTLTLRLRSVR